MGRKSKLTDEVANAICESIRRGNYAQVAARAAGISPPTYYSWLSRGEQAKSGKYVEFLDAIKEAEAEAEHRAVKVVADAMPSDWKAAMTYLERRYPDRWGRRERHEHTGEGGGPVTLKVVYDD